MRIVLPRGAERTSLPLLVGAAARGRRRAPEDVYGLPVQQRNGAHARRRDAARVGGPSQVERVAHVAVADGEAQH